jgi:asparagine synthase (glutamine-hydrolysing)
MCGIAGLVSQKKSVDPQVVRSMLATLTHRGPEDEGVFFDTEGTVALGQCRLAIIDLSPGGHQPMTSADGRYTLTFNGEIYNYIELRSELKGQGYSFHTESDTEVLLHAFIAWGETCIEKLRGMFAFAVWDSREKRLFAARDRMGEKPFVYAVVRNTLFFASELKALLSSKEIAREIDWSVMSDVLALRFVPAPSTGIKGVHKLPAGHSLVFSHGQVEIKRYTSRIVKEQFESLELTKKNLWHTFQAAAVSCLTTSDVPVGAFLSGGLDSSSVVAALVRAGHTPKTYCVAVGEESEDIRAARLVARHFGLEKTHEEIIVPATALEDMVQKVIQTYDEPFTDQSAVPSLIIAEHMKKYATVVLGGDGADELFGGYDTYQHMRLFKQMARIPNGVRLQFAQMMAHVSAKAAYPFEIMTGDVYDMYVKRFSVWKKSLPLSKRYITEDDLFTPQFREKMHGSESSLERWLRMYASEGPLKAALLADQEGRLPDGYLYKVDMASMRSAVEVRSPFLDPRLVELANQTPAAFHVRGKGKWVWRQMVKDILPPHVLQRKKKGFSMPLDRLFNEQFGVFAKQVLLRPERETKELFREDIVEKLFRDHALGKADYSNHLWALLMIELWITNLKK